MRDAEALRLMASNLGSQTHLQVWPVNRFSRIMAQTTRTRASMCLIGDFSHGFQFRESNFLNQKTPIWGVNKRFQAKLAKSKNVHIIKTTASIPTKFCTLIKTAKCPSWVVPTHAAQIQDGGRPSSWKNRKIAIDFDEIWHNAAVRPSRPFWPLKNCNLKNPKWRQPPF